MISMYVRFFLFISLAFLFSCKETVFDAGLENRIIAIIDRVPESYEKKLDFTSDEEVSDCSDHDVLYIDRIDDDGSLDNKHYRLILEARDYFRDKNNCDDYDEDKPLRHKLIITAFAEEINDKMYIKGTPYVVNLPGTTNSSLVSNTNSMVAYYHLKENKYGNDNDGDGIEYYGFEAEIEIEELNLGDGTASGFFNATLYRANDVSDPEGFAGVEVSPNVDLFNPSDTDGDGLSDDPLGNVENGILDSIRIENGVFQRINVITNY